MIFSDYAKHVNGKLTTCDIEKKNIKSAKKFVKNNRDFVDFIVDDSINFLSYFDQKIDLFIGSVILKNLFFDSMLQHPIAS